MGEASETEGGAFDAFHEVVDRIGGAVADPSLMPVGDLVMPTRGEPRRYRRPGWDRLGLWGFAALKLNGVRACEVSNGYLFHAVSHPLSRLWSCSIR